LNYGAPEARKIDCHNQSAVKVQMKESGVIVCKKAQHFNERHKGCITHLKGKNCLFAFRFFFLSCLLQFHAAGGPFFLVVSENIAASSTSFLQAVLLGWCVSSYIVWLDTA
jgi:hypothetical protein